MNKELLIDQLSKRFDKPVKEVREMVNALFDMMKDTLCGEKDVHIVGFGKFFVKERQARPGRNPNTGEKIVLPKTKTLAFLPSQTFRALIKKCLVK